MDMNEDRDYLNHFIFPKIKEYCRNRYIDFIPIDLRWGITEEESSNGLVVNSCLSEINGCRPFFIGILGGRYGWCPDKNDLNIIDSNLVKDVEWIKSCLEERLSITEIEIRYAVLRDMDMPHATFFLRNSNICHPDNFYEISGSDANTKLQALKDAIKSQKKYKYFSYDNPEELGELIYDEIIRFIDSEFPNENCDKEQAIIRPHIETLKRRISYLDLSYMFPTIDSAWERGAQFFIIFGDDGSGTSTVLAEYLSYLQNSDRNQKVIYFDFEAVPFGINPIHAYTEFMMLDKNLQSKENGATICIDNSSILNADEAASLCYLLKYSGNKNRYLITLSNNCSMGMEIIFSGIQLEFLTICRLLNNETGIKRFVISYAQKFGKKFSEDQLKLISTTSTITNPTDLKILLDSIINYGYYDTLDKYIKTLIDSCTDNYSQKNYRASVFFNKMLDEYIQIFDKIDLSQQFLNILQCIALLNGVSERVLIEGLEISLQDWSLIRPAVMKFCKGTTERLYLVKLQWELEVIKFQTAKISAPILMKLLNYLFHKSIDNHSVLVIFFQINRLYSGINTLSESDKDEFIELGHKIIDKLYLPSEFNLLTGEDINYLCTISTRLLDKKQFIKFIKHKITKGITEICEYLTKIANYFEANNRLDYAADCYSLLSELLRDKHPKLSLIFKAQSYLIKGNPSKAIHILKQSGLNGGNPISNFFRHINGSYMDFQMSCLLANSCLLKSYLLKCDFENAINIYGKLLKRIYSIDDKGEWINSF